MTACCICVQVRITFNVDGARELPDDAVQLHYTDTSLFVSIVDQRGTQRSLSIDKLFGPIRTATMKRSNAQARVHTSTIADEVLFADTVAAVSDAFVR